jgi:ketosteroid isomerase-like protein
MARTWARLPPRFWLRRMMLARAVPLTCAAFNRRDFAAFLLGIDPGVEFWGARDLLGPDQTEVTVGHEEYLEFFQYWINAFDDLRYEPEEALDLGDKFLVTVHLRGHGLGSGIAVSQRLFTLSHLRQGLVVKQENFLDRSKALEAVGLAE